MKLRNVPKWKYNRIVIISLSDNDAARRLRFTPLLSSSKFPAFSASKCLQNSSIIQNNSVTLQSVVISNVFVTCCNSPVKVQNICETTNFFMNYFLSRTRVTLTKCYPFAKKDSHKKTSCKALVMAHAYSNVVMDKIEECIKNGLSGNENDNW